jgi:hypothetical protein
MKEACAQLDQEPDDGSGMKVVKRETGEGSELGGDGAPLLLPPVSSEICDSVDAMNRYLLQSMSAMIRYGLQSMDAMIRLRLPSMDAMKTYTVKKAFRYSRPQPGCHLPRSSYAGIIYR